MTLCRLVANGSFRAQGVFAGLIFISRTDESSQGDRRAQRSLLANGTRRSWRMCTADGSSRRQRVVTDGASDSRDLLGARTGTTEDGENEDRARSSSGQIGRRGILRCITAGIGAQGGRTTVIVFGVHSFEPVQMTWTKTACKCMPDCGSVFRKIEVYAGQACDRCIGAPHREEEEEDQSM